MQDNGTKQNVPILYFLVSELLYEIIGQAKNFVNIEKKKNN